VVMGCCYPTRTYIVSNISYFNMEGFILTELEKIHGDLEELVEKVRHLTYGVFQHNPAFEGNEKPSLAVLGIEARAIGTAFEIIGSNLIKVHEEKQIESIHT